jgi:hypothetical protein
MVKAIIGDVRKVYNLLEIVLLHLPRTGNNEITGLRGK